MQQLRPRTVKILSRLLLPLVDEGIIAQSELNIITSNLRHVIAKGEILPVVQPRLINQQETADLLSIGLANFKKLERANAFPFKRKMVGSSVRYRNIDVISFIASNET